MAVPFKFSLLAVNQLLLLVSFFLLIFLPFFHFKVFSALMVSDDAYLFSWLIVCRKKHQSFLNCFYAYERVEGRNT